MQLVGEHNKLHTNPKGIMTSVWNGPAAPAIELHDLGHTYATGSGALVDLSLEVSLGEIFGLLGPNGGGKTTLFRILATLMVPTDGHAIIAGADVEQNPAAVRRNV